MTKWEYTECSADRARLEDFGACGWEAYAVVEVGVPCVRRYHFKRPIQEPPATRRLSDEEAEAAWRGHFADGECSHSFLHFGDGCSVCRVPNETLACAECGTALRLRPVFQSKEAPSGG